MKTGAWKQHVTLLEHTDATQLALIHYTNPALADSLDNLVEGDRLPIMSVSRRSIVARPARVGWL